MSSQQILTTVMTRIVVDKTIHHAKPHSICFLPQYQRNEIFVLTTENTDSDLKVHAKVSVTDNDKWRGSIFTLSELFRPEL